jgi:predicted DNA-binding transcriptional regulator AlpA
MNKLLTSDQTAEFLGVKWATLHAWRAKRIGPKYIKVGRSVRYDPQDLNEWLTTRVVEPASAEMT